MLSHEKTCTVGQLQLEEPNFRLQCKPFLTLNRKALSEPSLQSLAVEIFTPAESLENRLGRFYPAKSHRSTVMKVAKNVRRLGKREGCRPHTTVSYCEPNHFEIRSFQSSYVMGCSKGFLLRTLLSTKLARAKTTKTLTEGSYEVFRFG